MSIPLRLLAPLLFAATSACDGTTIFFASSASDGRIEVFIATEGGTRVGGDFTLLLDGGDARSGGTSRVVFDGVRAGTHHVTVAALPDGCALEGDNPRRVAVPPGGTATIRLTVRCAPLSSRAQRGI